MSVRFEICNHANDTVMDVSVAAVLFSLLSSRGQ